MNMIEEFPQTAEELYAVVNKYCSHWSVIDQDFGVSQANEMDPNSGKAIIPILYRVFGHSKRENDQGKLVRTIWLALLPHISKCKDPCVLWRRAPYYEVFKDKGEPEETTSLSARVAIFDRKNHEEKEKC